MAEFVVIVGAGPAGLAAAGELRRRGIDAVVLERADQVAAVWRSRHDHLRLNTHRALSHQPGMRIPRRCGPYPSRDDYVRYLERFAEGMRIEFGSAVSRVDRVDNGWRLSLQSGDTVVSERVVVATGPDAVPVRPAWPGILGFSGAVIPAGEFRNVADVAGQDVLIVGPGNSGVDLLNHLVGSSAGRLWLSARAGMNLTPKTLAGVHLHLVSVAGRRLPDSIQDLLLRGIQRLAFGDLTRLGYPRSRLGAFSRAASDGVTVAVDDGFVAGLKSGRVVMKPAITGFRGRDVEFTDGTWCAPDLVICATGYRPDLVDLVGHLVDLDDRGMPPFTGANRSPAHPGLWFFGVDRSIYGNMNIRRRQARELGRLIAAG